MKKILQIDGGGIRGIIPAIVLEHLEEKCGKPLGQCFDLITGTSTGSIIGGAIAAGVPAKKIRELYTDKGEELFTRRTLLNPFNWSWSLGKYDGEPFKNEMRKLSGINKTGEQVKFEDLILADLTPHFVATTFNLSSQRTHFINSWQDKGYKEIQDKNRKLLDVISWSALSAVYYFDPITVDDFEWQDGLTENAKKKGAVFQDGGQGAHNNTLGYVLTEILASRWTQQGEIYILSLGTGYQTHISHDSVLKKDSAIKRLWSYFRCQAGKESAVTQILAASYISSDDEHNKHPKIEFKRIDKDLPEEQANGLDKVEYIKEYQAIGDELKNSINQTDVDYLLSK